VREWEGGDKASNSCCSVDLRSCVVVSRNHLPFLPLSLMIGCNRTQSRPI
jgi:hypothetical protein